MTTLHGIPNCDTIKKARAWLDARAIPYAFHDYKKAGIAPETLAAWAARAGWQRLLNRSGTTFRKLPPDATANLDEARALALMAAQPSLIRRPVLTRGEVLEIGFDPARYAAIFGA
ncbi:MAG: arsenate reductase [Acetobacteraceae bacterium]